VPLLVNLHRFGHVAEADAVAVAAGHHIDRVGAQAASV
jgi:hypothetical protein